MNHPTHTNTRWAVMPCLALLAALCCLDTKAANPEPYNSEPSSSRPLPPATAAAQWKLPDGFKATVFAAEPDVRQPIAMAFDRHGRLWVAECYTYAEVRKGFDTTLKDRILIFEDTDGDGVHDRRKVFADGLERLSSIEVDREAVWALASPQLLRFRDHDGDDVPDAPPDVVLDGFDWRSNHHTMANGLRWGPDGWLYGRHGIQATSALGAPGTPEAARTRTNGGIWRYHPQRRTVEVVCHGTTNPWGMDWNELGEAFFINTVIGHLWHVIPGAHYRRMHGNDLNPYAYEVMEQHADHVHWAVGEAWNSWQKLGITDATSAAGGGHAHTGLMFYAGDNWPPIWKDKLLTINFNGRRLNVENVTRDPHGSGYVGRHVQDIGFAADPWFRGIDLLYGPDGGVYVADWSDTGECHDNDGVFRQSGRIYKITFTNAGPNTITDSDRQLLPVTISTPEMLATLLSHPNEFFTRQALRQLNEHRRQGVEFPGLGAAARARFDSQTNLVQRLRALWALHAVDDADAAFLRTQLQDREEAVRAWAIRLLVDDPARIATDRISLQALLDTARNERSAFVRLALASALQRLPLNERGPIARPLLQRSEDAADANLPPMLWYALEPLSLTSPDLLAELAVECALPLTRRCIARRLTSRADQHPSALNTLLRQAAAAPRLQADVLTGMHLALAGQSRPTPPEAWATTARVFATNDDPAVIEAFRALGTLYRDPAAMEATRALVEDRSRSLTARRAALRALIDNQDPELHTLCAKSLTVPGLAATAAAGLAITPDLTTATLILDRFPNLQAADQPAVLSALLTRPAWAARALDAVAANQLPRSALTAYHTRQIRAHEDDDLNRKLREVWGETRDIDANKQSQIQGWKRKLTPEILAKTDSARGRELFGTACGLCHRLNGAGGAVGPELNGSARDNLDYLLQNIIDPNAAVAREFQTTTVELKNGQTLTGFIRSRANRVLVLQTLAEVISLPENDIAHLQTAAASLMPEGLLESLSETDVRDLIGYLMLK